jgi:hypothetical protein
MYPPHLNPLTDPLFSLKFLLPVLLLILLTRRYASRLSSVPGPAWASVTRLWHVYRLWKGDYIVHLLALHEQYGHFIRIAPNEVSVSHPDAIKKVLLAPLRKSDWDRIFAGPDYR